MQGEKRGGKKAAETKAKTAALRWLKSKVPTTILGKFGL